MALPLRKCFFFGFPKVLWNGLYDTIVKTIRDHVDLFRRIIFSILGHGMWFLKNLYFIFMVWRNYSHWIEFGKFSSQFYGEYLLLIWFFLLIATEFDLKITFRILNPENHQVYQWKSAKCCYFQKRFQYHIVFQYQSKIIRVIGLKKKRINILFIAVIYFPLSIKMNILTLYYMYLIRNFSYVNAWFRPRAVI